MTDANLARATIQNNANSTLTIESGYVWGYYQQAISNEGTLILGVEGGNLSTTSPIIQGKTYGVVSIGDIEFYDGVVKGVDGAFSGTVGTIEANTQILDSSETVDDKTYLKEYLASTL